MGSFLGRLALVGALLLTATKASALSIAIFGNNNIDNFLSGQGHAVTLASDANLATAGFLNPFDLFIYTRDGGSFGTALSAAAEANVEAFVTGNVVLFGSDLADRIGLGAPEGQDPNANQALLNAVAFAGEKGYIGEFTGACAAMTGGAGGVSTRLGFVPGNCTGLAGSDGDPTDILIPGHPVAAGLPDPWSSPGGMNFFAFTNTPASWVVARGVQNQLPTIVATPVPEPTTLVLLAAGLLAAGALRRRTA